jgi:hypothetical protein
MNLRQVTVAQQTITRATFPSGNRLRPSGVQVEIRRAPGGFKGDDHVRAFYHLRRNAPFSWLLRSFSRPGPAWSSLRTTPSHTLRWSTLAARGRNSIEPVVAGHTITTTLGSQICPGRLSEARAVVQSLKEQRADCVKVYDGLSRDSCFAIIDEAKKLGVPVVGHLRSAIGLREASKLSNDP